VAILCASCALVNNDQESAPRSVVLAQASNVTPFSLDLSWTEAAESDDFVAYKVYFSSRPGVSQDDQFGISVVYRDVTTCALSGFKPNAAYYFRVFVCGPAQCAGSNEICVTTVTCTCATSEGTRHGSSVLLPPGCFVDANGHMAVISRSFYMDTTEITEKQWDRLMGSDTCLSLKPITRMTWYEAVLYCNKRSKSEGLDTCYQIVNLRDTLSLFGDTVSVFGCSCDFSKNGYRLPTEDEWEYAYRVGARGPFFWTHACSSGLVCSYPSTPADSQEVSRYAWWYGNRKEGGGGPKAVAQKLPNGFGLYDMAGNVQEYAWDGYAEDGTGRPAMDRVDHRGSAATTMRIARGGYYDDGVLYLSASSTALSNPEARVESTGFRVVRTHVQ
jgi:formylglycine-generating enzyme required for sulfatase activity